MSRIYNSILEKIGDTPLVRLQTMNTTKAEILVKLESFNPGGSAKDRIAAEMIETAERTGQLKPGAVIVEPTSGNTGIGLALAGAVKKHPVILTMPDTMSIERRKLLAAYGAQLVLTPGSEGMSGAIRKAQEIVAGTPGAFLPQQFENPANAEAHRKTTAREILRDTDGQLDIFIASVGTGGTLTGVGEVLKEQNPSIRIVAVEPSDSPVLSGGAPGPHKLQGIGAGFIPKVLNTGIIDQVIAVTTEEAGNASRKCARSEGILVGISSGAVLHAALELGRLPENAGKRIIALLPDTGERYLSSWLFEA